MRIRVTLEITQIHGDLSAIASTIANAVRHDGRVQYSPVRIVAIKDISGPRDV